MSKLLSGFVAASMVVMMLGAVVAPAPASAATIEELQALIASLTAQIAALSGQTSTPGASVTFTSNLTVGSRGAEVTALQNFLVAKGYLVMPAGVAPGYFGALTKSAVAAYQAAKGIAPAVGYFGPMTRAAVNAEGTTTTPGTPSTPGSLQGGAGDITVTERNSGVSDEVLEGEEEVKVLGFEIEAEGSDVAVTSVRVELMNEGSGSDRLNRYVDEVLIMMGSKVVGSADADDFSESSDVYSRNIPVTGVVVGEDDTERFYVALSAVNNIDSGDLSKDWEVALGQIRFEDATGAILTDNTGTGVNSTADTYGPISEVITFEDLSTTGDVELTVSEDDDSINEDHAVAVEDASDTSDVEILSFKIKAEGSDLTLNSIPFAITSTGAGVTEIINDLRLMMDGEEVGTVSMDTSSESTTGFASTTDTTRTATITDLDDDAVVVEEGDTVSFTLVADVNDIDGAFTSGDEVAVTITVDDIDAEDENGDTLADSATNGSANSSGIEFLSTGITVNTTNTSSSVDTKVSDVATDDQGVYEVTFEVTAIEDDAYIELGAATRGTTENNTGVNFVIQDEPNSYAATTTGSIALSEVTRVSGGSVSGDFIKIGAGAKATFKLKVYFDPGHVTGSSIGYRLYLYSVNSAATAVDATAQQVLTPEVNFRTGAVSIGN